MSKDKPNVAVIYIRILACLLAAALLFTIIYIIYMLTKKHYLETWFTESSEVFVNPYMGYAPWAASQNPEYMPEPDFSLAFAILYWSEFEPEKGVYDFEAFEKRNHFDHLTSFGVKYIIRFVCDYPGDPGHIDIPEWLYGETNGAGVYYENYGMAGFAPDYSNDIIKERHNLALRALAERYDGSSDIAYIQLGSLGQWGEWHHWVSPDFPFPDSSVTDSYVWQYVSEFKETLLQMRRPYGSLKDSRIGFFNDLIGQSDSAYEWLGWIDDFGLTDFYKTAPSGGEFSSNYTREDYFGEMYGDLKQASIDSHTTFIGGYPPDGNEFKANGEDLLKTIGYRFTARSVRYEDIANINNPIKISLVIENTGAAPFYYKWDLHFYFYDENNNQAAKINVSEINGWDIRDILPGQKTELNAVIPLSLHKGNYTIKLGLIDPFTQEPAVHFANEETDGFLLNIGHIAIKEWYERF